MLTLLSPRRRSVLSGAIARWDARQYSGSGSLPDLSGNGLHLTFPGGTNNPLWLPYTGTQYDRFPGLTGNYASAPDSAPLSITGDIDIRADVAMDDWTPAALSTLAAKYTTTGNQRSWRFDVATSGVLQLVNSTDGTATATIASTVAPTIGDGGRLQVRATLDVDNGAGNRVTNFYTRSASLGLALTDNTNWTQLGTTVTTGGTTSIFDSTAVVELGSITLGTAQLPTGNLYAAAILNGINGTVAFDWRASQATSPYATSTEASSNAATVTYNRAATGRKLSVVDRPLFLFGLDDYLEVADNALLDFGATDSFTVVTVMRHYTHERTVAEALLAKKLTTGAGAGYALYKSSIANRVSAHCWDGSATPSPFVDFTGKNGLAGIAVLKRDVETDALQVQAFGVSGSPLTDTTTGTLSNDLALRIGMTSGASVPASFEFFGAAIFRRALRDAEIARLKFEMGLA